MRNLSTDLEEQREEVARGGYPKGNAGYNVESAARRDRR